ncbi:hypothetical protein CFP56_013506 [Quercus suber]|uniref:Uncharacterized protein n=1 Tax=Quercus suber TaxID=58331 RepID=A0AAW0KVI0_QUESU
MLEEASWKLRIPRGRQSSTQPVYFSYLSLLIDSNLVKFDLHSKIGIGYPNLKENGRERSKEVYAEEKKRKINKLRRQNLFLLDTWDFGYGTCFT